MLAHNNAAFDVLKSGERLMILCLLPNTSSFRGL